MSSTSLTETESRALTVSAEVPAGAAKTPVTPPKSVISPWQFYVVATFLAAAAVVWLSPTASPVALLFLSLGVAAAGACALALHALLSALGGTRTREAEITAHGRAALDREKMLALRAIKDLEFDKAMGKVSAADAAPMEARLRERAAAIMRELDGRESLRARVERDLAQRQATDHRPPATGTVCVCGTANDADAKFCKNCGQKL